MEREARLRAGSAELEQQRVEFQTARVLEERELKKQRYRHELLNAGLVEKFEITKDDPGYVTPAAAHAAKDAAEQSDAAANTMSADDADAEGPHADPADEFSLFVDVAKLMPVDGQGRIACGGNNLY